MSNAAGLKVGQAVTKPKVNISKYEIIRATHKNQAQATSHLLPIDTHMMYKTLSSKL